MKICFVTDTFCDVNGVSRFLQDMVQIASKRGDLLYLITSTSKTQCRNLHNVINIKPLFARPMPYYKELDLVFPSYKKISRKLDEISPDCIHISTPGFVGLCGWYYAKKKGIPIAGTYHTDFPAYVEKNTKIRLFGWITQRYMRFFYKDFSLMFARSDAYLQTLENKIATKSTELKALKPGTDTLKFLPTFKHDNFKNKHNIDQNHKLFLYVGRITKEKNIEWILDLFSQNLYDKKATLLLAGAGNIKQYQKSYKSESIRFLGNRRGDELHELYANADCFIFPSITDTLGQVVLEALSSAVPVIVSNIGGPKEIVSKAAQEVGFILEHDNKELWIARVDDIIHDRVDLEKLGKNARKYALTLDIQKSYEDFILHHRKLIDKYRG